MGAHVIKVVCRHPDRPDGEGFVTGLALNGAGIVHDFELAVAGADTGRGRGSRFRRLWHGARRARDQPGDRRGRPRRPEIGASLGYLTRRKPRHLGVSLLAAARARLPATVHVAISTDIVHMHPACDPAAVGAARIWTSGCWRKWRGSAAAGLQTSARRGAPAGSLLEAVTLARNLGHAIKISPPSACGCIQSIGRHERVTRRPGRGRGIS
jgi:hypothetical protein